MSDATRTRVTYRFKDLDTHRVEATIQPENVASIRHAESLGFRREVVLRDRSLVDGTYRRRDVRALGKTSSASEALGSDRLACAASASASSGPSAEEGKR
jgi:RimJ/RimL family protein N-acetyltransferase